MKMVVSSTGKNLDAKIDPRFGRCQYFLIVDSETMNFESLQNESASATGGAGIQAAQTVAGKGVQVVITGNVGPNAFQTLAAAGIKIITGASGTVKDAIEKFKSGELSEISSATVGTHFGSGRGMGRGMMPMQQPIQPFMPTQMSEEQEKQMLKNQINGLEQQLKQMKKRLEELGGE